MPKYLSLALVTCLLILYRPVPLLAQSARTATADLTQLVQNAHTIVRGQVLSTKIEPHPQFPNLQTVVVTFAVTKLLKGEPTSTLVFRQYFWDPTDLHSAAGYKKAGELLLFLNPVSPYGLTSPVGLEQGRFRILRDAKGNRYALNGRGNAGLFTHVADIALSRGATLSKPATLMLARPADQAPLDVFEETILALVQVSR